MKTRRVGKHRECVQTGKICFNSPEEAQKRIQKICGETDQSGKRWGQYRCPHCNRIHLSSGVRGKFVSTETARRKLKLQGDIE